MTTVHIERMAALKKMLVIADPGVDQTALFFRASELAASSGCEVEVVGFTGADLALTQLDDTDLAKQLELAIAGQFANSGQVACRVVHTKDIGEWVIQKCNIEAVDLVVKTGRRSEQLLHQPTDWHLIRELTCSLLLLSEKKWSAKNVVLATVDIEKDDTLQQAMNKNVVSWAKLLSDYSHTESHLMTCVEINRALAELDMISAEEVARKKQRALEAQMRELARELNVHQDGYWVSAGQPHKKIPSLANKLKADLVVMGSIGRKGIGGLLLGNTAERVLRHIRTDVLVVKP